MVDDRLLPTMSTLRGGETLRVLGADGRKSLLPLTALLAMAEQRFVTLARESAELAAVNTYCHQLNQRVAALEGKPTPTGDLAPLPAAIQSLRNVTDTLGAALAALDARLALVEAALTIKPKDKDK